MRVCVCDVISVLLTICDGETGAGGCAHTQPCMRIVNVNSEYSIVVVVVVVVGIYAKNIGFFTFTGDSPDAPKTGFSDPLREAGA